MTETMSAQRPGPRTSARPPTAPGAALVLRGSRVTGARHGGGETLCTDSAHRADLISHAGLPRLRGLHVVAQTNGRALTSIRVPRLQIECL